MWVAIEDHLGAFGGHGRPFGVRWIGIWGNVVALDAHWVVRGSHLGRIWWPDHLDMYSITCSIFKVGHHFQGTFSKCLSFAASQENCGKFALGPIGGRAALESSRLFWEDSVRKF